MRLTVKSEYGLLALIELASRHGSGPVSAREMSERQGIPAKYLEQLLVSLRRGGLVSAVRGAHGGFELARSPEAVSVLEVVEALEGPLAPTVCQGGREGECGRSHACAASGVWERATEALREVFQSCTLAELAADQTALDIAVAREKV